jgi:hypothetical protein
LAVQAEDVLVLVVADVDVVRVVLVVILIEDTFVSALVVVVDDVIRLVLAVVLVKYLFFVGDIVVVDTVVDVEMLELLFSILLIVVKTGYFPWLQNAFVKSSKSKAHIIAPLKDLLIL